VLIMGVDKKKENKKNSQDTKKKKLRLAAKS
jgi:hypothetical protein